jgi:acyl-CoA synthetase (NDP forming)
VLVLHVGFGGEDPEARLRALEDAASGAAKPVVASVVGSSGELPVRETWRVPNFRFPVAAVGALALAADRRDWLSRPLGQVPVVGDLDLDGARALVARLGDGWVQPADAEALLAAVGIDVLHAEPCDDPDAAVRAAAAAGGPVVLKAGRDEALRGLEGDVAVAAAWHELVRRTGASRILVQRLAEPGADAVLGVAADPDLGPVVGVGARGGPLAYRMAPMTDVDADELTADAPALRPAVVRLAALSAAVPELAEVDLQPVRVTGEASIVLDARIRLGPAAERSRVKTW